MKEAASSRNRKSHLIRASLLAVDWTGEYGLAVQVGLGDAVDDLNQIAQWLSENRDREVILIDDLENKESSFLDGMKAQSGAHYHVPPTLQGNVRLYREAPEFHFPILLLSVATTNHAEIAPVISRVRRGSVLYGTAEACSVALKAAQCEAQPLYFHGDRVAVRVV